jgi:pyruvate dehydrogenase E1 component alpha subunit
LVSTEAIVKFEKSIADLYKQGRIPFPVHLRSGREEQLRKVFLEEGIGKSDWVYAYWDAHDICLLKGVPSEMVRKAIIYGNSIALSFPDYNVLCSGIAGSLMGVACGHAWGLKAKGSKSRVFLFCGDMSAEMGIFHEAVKYAYNNILPIKFIVSNNGMSVLTPTEKAWGESMSWWADTCYQDMIIEFDYVNGYPHSGIGARVKF